MCHADDNEALQPMNDVSQQWRCDDNDNDNDDDDEALQQLNDVSQQWRCDDNDNDNDDHNEALRASWSCQGNKPEGCKNVCVQIQ